MKKRIIAATGALLLLATPAFAQGAGGGTSPSIQGEPSEPGAGTLDPTNQDRPKTEPSDNSSGASGQSPGTSGTDMPSTNQNQQDVNPPSDGSVRQQ